MLQVLITLETLCKCTNFSKTFSNRSKQMHSILYLEIWVLSWILPWIPSQFWVKKAWLIQEYRLFSRQKDDLCMNCSGKKTVFMYKSEHFKEKGIFASEVKMRHAKIKVKIKLWNFGTRKQLVAELSAKLVISFKSC